MATLHVPLQADADDTQQRRESIQFRCSDEEKADLIRAADAVGLPVGAWVRSLALREARRTES